MSALVVISIKYVSVMFFFSDKYRHFAMSHHSCPYCPVSPYFTVIYNTSWVRYGYPRLTTSCLYLSQEWHLVCSHYIILVAFKGSCQSIKDVLFRQQTGTKIIFVKGTVQHFGQIAPPPPPNSRGGRTHKNSRVLFSSINLSIKFI